ncbi:Two-component sensor histidine kinase, contains HisKA and HATPase domains [Reichenbachiella faecimaris]|uniref:histidine kinase n=1 Tax=Reichenbachiella faecimaris TaxID=692418 RepID=A0A1W2GKY7_REIFA|nr:histidine kinase dimerization/phosphoacceptor domain -containing protein [Reichenbachiella faecimaris]SMD36936.1 Two-component sensor histidine kinase, contains HisKA and HATPase domains [Reichenbachiella faecimaris]
MNRTFWLMIIFLTHWRIAMAQTSEFDSLYRMLDQPLGDSVKGYVLDELSYVWFYSNLDSSLTYAKKSLQTFESLDLEKGIAQAYTSIAVAYHYKNNWDSAEANYQKAKSFKEAIGDEVGIAGSLNNLGVLYMDKGDLEAAANQFLTSLKLKENLGDSAGMASGNANLGLILRKQGNHEGALSYYSKALRILLQLNSKKSLPTIYLNIGSLYNYKLDYDSGLYYNRKTLDIARELNSVRYIGESYVNLSNSFLGLEALDSGIYYIDEAVEIFRSNADTVNLCKALIAASSIRFENREYKSALDAALEVKKLNKERNPDLEVDYYFSLAKSYEGLGQMDEAYESLLSAYSAKDSLLNKSLNETIANLTAQYESEKKERQILALERDKIETDLNLAQSNNQKNVLLLASALILGVSILIYRLYRVKVKSEGQIAKSLAEKETLLKEIHHRVKNNLQVVSSLLSMQSRFIKDEEALGAVNEGQSRVQSMALIHQKLYMENNLSGVKAKEYIEDLTEILKESYQTGIDVDFEYVVDDLTIDVDTIIPIGLILNELICNALKHAFTPGSKGIVSIKLQEKNEELVLEVSDNGIGSNGETSSESFGIVLIESLASKLKARLEVIADHGTSTVLHITKYKLA